MKIKLFFALLFFPLLLSCSVSSSSNSGPNPISYPIADFEPDGSYKVYVESSTTENSMGVQSGSNAFCSWSGSLANTTGNTSLGNYIMKISGTVRQNTTCTLGYYFETYSTKATVGTAFPGATKLRFDYLYDGDVDLKFYIAISKGDPAVPSSMYATKATLTNDNAWHSQEVDLTTGFSGTAFSEVITDLSCIRILVQTATGENPETDVNINNFSIDNVRLTN